MGRAKRWNCQLPAQLGITINAIYLLNNPNMGFQKWGQRRQRAEVRRNILVALQESTIIVAGRVEVWKLALDSLPVLGSLERNAWVLTGGPGEMYRERGDGVVRMRGCCIEWIKGCGSLIGVWGGEGCDADRASDPASAGLSWSQVVGKMANFTGQRFATAHSHRLCPVTAGRIQEGRKEFWTDGHDQKILALLVSSMGDRNCEDWYLVCQWSI